MSKSDKKVAESSPGDNVADRLRDSLNLDTDKPDTPLRSSSGGFSTSSNASSSFSSSSSASAPVSSSGNGSGSVKGKRKSNVREKKVKFDESVKSSSGSGSSESSKRRGPAAKVGRMWNKFFKPDKHQKRFGASPVKSPPSPAGSPAKSPPSPTSAIAGSPAYYVTSPLPSPRSAKAGSAAYYVTSPPPTPRSARADSNGGSQKPPSSPSMKTGTGGSGKPQSSPSSGKSGTGGSAKSKSSPSSGKTGTGASAKSKSSPSSGKSGTGGSGRPQSTHSSGKSGTGASAKSQPSPSSGKSGTGASAKSKSSPSSGKSGTDGSGKSQSSPSSASSPRILPMGPRGNIYLSGDVKTGMASNSQKTARLNPESTTYSYGSVIWPRTVSKKSAAAFSRNDPDELKQAGNELYKNGNFEQALRFYDKAISLIPTNVTFRANRAAALIGLRRFHEALKECHEALKLDPKQARIHQWTGNLLFRFGQVEDARMHLHLSGHKPTPEEQRRWEAIDKQISICVNARKSGNWTNLLKECDAAIVAGADHCPEIFTCKAVALVKLHKLDDAVAVLSRVPKYERPNYSGTAVPRFGMLSEAYYLFVGAQIDLAFGRFDNAITAAEKAANVDTRSVEIKKFHKNATLITRARNRGNDLFKSERFTEATLAYGEGLKLDPSNAVLYSNRAACSFKLGQWETSIEDCNRAIEIQPKYVKALLRRAACNSTLERWADAVRDYKTLNTEIPEDNEVAQSLFRAHVALRKSREEDISDMKYGGEVEEVSSIDQFDNAVSWSGVSVVQFSVHDIAKHEQISVFFDTLCERYPMVHFVMVDIDENQAIAKTESVEVIPTYKIFRNGKVIKEMICPNQQVLENSVRHYGI